MIMFHLTITKQRFCYLRKIGLIFLGFYSFLILACDLTKNHSAETQGLFNKDYLPNEVLVRFKEDVREEEIKIFGDELSLTVIEKIKGTDIYSFRLPCEMTVEEAIKKIKQRKEIRYVQPNYIYRFKD